MAHTTCGSEKPTEESTRERDLGASVGRDSPRYGSRSMCAPPAPPWTPRLGAPSLLLPPPPQSPGSHTLNSSHWALVWGRVVCWVHRSQVPCLGGPLGDVADRSWSVSSPPPPPICARSVLTPPPLSLFCPLVPLDSVCPVLVNTPAVAVRGAELRPEPGMSTQLPT